MAFGAEIEVIPADKINEAYERVLASDVRYRFVIDISTLRNVVEQTDQDATN